MTARFIGRLALQRQMLPAQPFDAAEPSTTIDVESSNTPLQTESGDRLMTEAADTSDYVDHGFGRLHPRA